MGEKLGRYIVISPTTSNRVNLSKAWLKVEIENVFEVPSHLQVNLLTETCSIEVEVFLSFKVPLRAFTGYSSQTSSHGSCCRPTSPDIPSLPSSLLFGVGSAEAIRDAYSPHSSSSSCQDVFLGRVDIGFSQLQEGNALCSISSSPVRHRLSPAGICENKESVGS